MTNQGKDPKCRFWCWAIAALAGAFIFIMLLGVAAKSFGASLFLGLIGFVLLGALFNWLFCSPVPKIDQNRASSAAGAAAGAGAAVATAAAAGAAASTAPAAAAPSEAATAATDASETNVEAAPVVEPEAVAPVTVVEDTVEVPEDVSTSAAEATGASVSTSAAPTVEVKPSTPLAGEAELAERKGEYRYEAPAAEEDAKPKAKKAKAKGKAAKAKAAADAVEEGDAKATGKAKGAGKGKDKAKGEAGGKRKAKRQAAKAAAAEAAAATPDFDGDGVLEGADEGTKPELLTAARDGGADDLKRIKGIGPKLEGVCNDMGVYHFDQIAAWTDQEMAWVNANLQGFKGRAARDKWIEQAKLLAAGGETEFSKRVDKGSVY